MNASPLRAVADRQYVSSALHGKTVADTLSLFKNSQLVAYSPRSAKSFMTRFAPIVEAVGSRDVEGLSVTDGERVMIHVMSLSSSRTWKSCVKRAWGMYCRWLVMHEAQPKDLSIIWPRIKVRDKDLLRVKSDFSREEIARLCEPLSPQLRLFTWAAVLTGQRLSNLLDWQVQEIGADRVWTIPASKFKQGRALRIPIAAALWDKLQPLGKPPDHVLPGLPGETWIRDSIRAAAEKVGIEVERAHPHNFRRTCCRWLKESGVTREQVRTLFGWASDAVMLKCYWPITTDEENWKTMARM